MRPLVWLPIVGLLGCTAWGGAHPGATLPSDLSIRDRLEVWSAGGAQVLHGVRIESGVLAGVPYWKAPDCDSCLVVIPMDQIDSIRVRTFSLKRTAVLAGALRMLGWVMYLYGHIGY